jgi:L,D-transpeptidase ErfK/SrfK
MVWPMKKQLFLSLLGAFAIDPTIAATFSLPENGSVIGQVQKVVMKKGETLFVLAQRYDIGIQEMIRANPKIRFGSRFSKNIEVNIPSQYVLPSGERDGIVLNLAENRIYFFHPDKKEVSTYPCGVGKQGWSTPQGTTQIMGMEKNPAWRPPVSIRREAARGGRMLPVVVPPGPRNPLGRYAMRLGISGILIHGTPHPHTVGQRCSHGCIRMFAKNLKELFEKVTVGTSVRIIHEIHESKK